MTWIVFQIVNIWCQWCVVGLVYSWLNCEKDVARAGQSVSLTIRLTVVTCEEEEEKNINGAVMNDK